MGDLLVYLVALAAPLAFTFLAWRLKRGYDARTGRWRWPWLVAGNLCVLLALLGAMFVLAESYYRYWYDTTDNFVVAWTSRRWEQRHFRVNERANELAAETIGKFLDEHIDGPCPLAK
ncbi:MAG: hypothetical protein KF708_14650 [Pirellulales bacterium]|nr:hypothetical protein [Pirellulales bacterium]